ncbi:RsmD family RNA methyltransferase [Candidatus Saccharibacteria bacterium]|nr:RsmD family RNA methyltransferase [Candidatus Saccharibacteria bacterium]
MSRGKDKMERVRFTGLVPGGAAIGELENGKKVFCFGVLPGELAEVRITKEKSSYVEARLVAVVEASERRVAPRDEIYLSTSPWQVMDYDYELLQKRELVTEMFRGLPVEIGEVATDGQEWNYRNKMEFSFYGDEEGLHFAFYVRGTHYKQVVRTESLSAEPLWAKACECLGALNEMGAEARDLKTLIVRSDARGRAVAKLFVKNKEAKEMSSRVDVPGLAVVYSDAKSPASVTTEVWRVGETTLADELLGREYQYDVDGFFQINLPVYEMVLGEIVTWVEGERVLDLYAGVGTIGLSVARGKDLTLVEVDEKAYAELAKNVAGVTGAKAVLAKSEDALEYLTQVDTVIVDPPRAGMHQKLVDKLLMDGPKRVVYLSCNPVTQARDVEWLVKGRGDGAGSREGLAGGREGAGAYKIVCQKAYNFFPKTPHIENLVVLERR